MAMDGVQQMGCGELLVYVLWEGVMEDGGEGKMRYNGGFTMGVQRIVCVCIQNGLISVYIDRFDKCMYIQVY
jgi:hypothetical protein